MPAKAAIIAVIVIIAHTTIGLSTVSALTVPTFPSCSSPQGEQKVSYSEGTHGIVGDLREFVGSDTVYNLSGDTHIQCFCPESGDGIQTNWWKVDSLSDTDIEVLRKDGWEYIPNGSLWDLDDDPYVAKNVSYDCKLGGGAVLGVSTVVGQILGATDFAATGGTLILFSLMSLGTLLVVAGLLLRIR